MARKAPGRAHWKDIPLIELARMSPDEEVACRWFVDDFAGSYNIQKQGDTIEQMTIVAGGLTGRFLSYRKLARNNEPSAEAQT